MPGSVVGATVWGLSVECRPYAAPFWGWSSQNGQRAKIGWFSGCVRIGEASGSLERSGGARG